MKYTFLRFPEGKTKAVTLSYDDGCHDDIRLSETITRYGLKCTFNINSGLIGAKGRLTKNDIIEHLIKAGHEIAIHGHMHKAPVRVRAIEGIRDVLDCRLELETQFGGLVRGMAYADVCSTTESIKQYLKMLDIAYARVADADNNSFALPSDWFAWTPTAHHRNVKVLDYADEFINTDVNGKYCASRTPRLFYLWGHSYEFSRDNNWDLLDKICEKLSGQADVWYATNIEIHDYVQAYDSLIYRADGTAVYNPTVTTLWFDVDGKLYQINPGETVILT